MSEDPLLPLGADLRGLLTTLDVPLHRIEEITTAPSTKSSRAAFRLYFADGRLLKGRRFQSSSHARASLRAIAAAPPGTFPAILAHQGDSLLEEWIEGDPLDQAHDIAQIVSEVGRMLATLHETPAPNEPSGEEPRNDLLAKRDQLQREVDHLTAGGLLSRERAAQVLTIALASAPEQAQVGIAVRDVRAENLIRDRDGRLVWVDTGSVGIGPVDEDLARIWHHWPMDDGARALFLAAYQGVRNASAFLESLPFWTAVVLAHSARIRMERGTQEGVNAAAELVERLSSACELDGAPFPPPHPRPRLASADGGRTGESMWTIRGLRIAVGGNAPAPLAWLAEFFGPPDIESTGTPDVEIHLAIDEERYAATHSAGRQAGDRSMPAFTLDGGERPLDLWRDETDGRRLHDEAAELFFDVDPRRPHYRLLGRVDCARLRSALMRLVRELTTIHALSQGDLLVHASAVAVNESAVLFAGPSHSGKTSLLLHALDQAGVAFLTNDRALLAPGESAGHATTVRGSPTIVRFRSGSLDFLPVVTSADWQRSFPYSVTSEEARDKGTMADLLPVSGNRALFSMSPAQLCRWRGVTFAREAQARVLVFPRIDDGVDSCALRIIDSVEAAPLLATCLGFGSGQAGPTIVTAPTWRRHLPPAPADPAAVCHQLATGCMLLECRLGPAAFEAPGVWTAILRLAEGRMSASGGSHHGIRGSELSGASSGTIAGPLSGAPLAPLREPQSSGTL